ncbi:DUF4383 domain-containing protein [Leptolyngbya sp. NK1-12]|uniref:DUF4383 domain-containing protein n=1 Tax=Leptolyngbya sp. NK1-12 TaxID=2547451 RepID=A0AA97ASI9_9CYAN|nr:DUF4383 domain-containing protein [Leptolyngbya sp. NK1-12]WNZ27183.1 DUF4383 domain-containing protein [Leptolyngbya sp. NK1-12]
MSARNFALFSGIFFIAIGILGFVPGMVSIPPTQPDPELIVNTGYGYLFGLFPTNLVHNLVHIAVGVWGVTSARTPKSAILYCQAFAILYSLIAVMGLLPGAGTTFGLMPIFGGNVLLNLATAAIAAYFGFIKVSGIDVGPEDKGRVAS